MILWEAYLQRLELVLSYSIKIVQICANIFFKFFVAIFGSNYTVFIKFVHANLSESRRMIIDCQLSLLGNCLKTQLVGFKWADVLDFSMSLMWLLSYIHLNAQWIVLKQECLKRGVKRKLKKGRQAHKAIGFVAIVIVISLKSNMILSCYFSLSLFTFGFDSIGHWYHYVSRNCFEKNSIRSY